MVVAFIYLAEFSLRHLLHAYKSHLNKESVSTLVSLCHKKCAVEIDFTY